jgi:hypothetical protein
MCKWHLGLSFIVLFKSLITFFVLSPPTLDFNSTFIHVFGRFFGLGSLECLEVPLICQHTFFHTSRGGIGLAYVEVIVSTF